MVFFRLFIFGSKKIFGRFENDVLEQIFSFIVHPFRLTWFPIKSSYYLNESTIFYCEKDYFRRIVSIWTFSRIVIENKLELHAIFFFILLLHDSSQPSTSFSIESVEWTRWHAGWKSVPFCWIIVWFLRPISLSWMHCWWLIAFFHDAISINLGAWGNDSNRDCSACISMKKISKNTQWSLMATAKILKKHYLSLNRKWASTKPKTNCISINTIITAF